MWNQKKYICTMLLITLLSFMLSGCSSCSVSLAMKESSTSKSWKVSYKKSTSTMYKNIKVKENDSRILYLSGSCDKGSITLKLSQNDVCEEYDLSNQEEEIQVPLSKFNHGKVKMKLVIKKSESGQFCAHWE